MAEPLTKQRIEFECTHCGASGKAAAKLAGKNTRCPKCKTSIVIEPVDLSTSNPSDDLAERADELFGDLDIDNLAINESLDVADIIPVAESVLPKPKPKPTKKTGKPAKRAKPAAKRPVAKKPKAVANKPAPTKPPEPQPEPDPQPEHELEDLEIPEGPIAFDSADLPDAQQQLDAIHSGAGQIDEEVETDGVFGVPCKICDTRIHAKESQVGTSVECPMCFTKVEIPEPSKKFLDAKEAAKRLASEDSDEKTRAAKRAFAPGEENDDDLFKLAEAVERPPVDYSIEEGYGLSPVEENLLTVPTEQEAIELDEGDLVLAPPAEIVGVLPSAKAEANVAEAKPRQHPKRKTKPEKPKEARRKLADEPNDEDESPAERFEFSEEGEKISWPLLREWLGPLKKNPEFLIRAALATVFLSLGYLMFDILFGIINDSGLQSADKLVRGALPAVGGTLCMVIATLTLCIVFAVIYRDAASDNQAFDNWIGFEFSEWMGSVAFVGFSVWLAAIPGLIVGNIGWAATETISTLFICTAISVFLFSPMFLISALYNDAVMHVFSLDIFQTVQSDRPSWLSMLKFVGLSLLMFLVGFAILCIPFFPVNFIGAAIHVFTAVFFALVIGLQARRAISVIQKAEEY